MPANQESTKIFFVAVQLGLSEIIENPGTKEIHGVSPHHIFFGTIKLPTINSIPIGTKNS